TILDLLNELDAQGYDTKAIRAEFFASTTPTPDQILQRVAENFGKIEDMRAKMKNWGSAGTKTFPVVERRFLFKKPDKMKFITPDINRTMIINGDVTFEIDERGSRSITISDYTGFSEKQIDFRYHLQEVMNTHNITFTEEQGFNNSIYMLELTPNEPNIIYGKLIIYIDYDKGIDVKTNAFSENGEILFSKETVVSELYKNIWVPTGYSEKMYFEDGIIETNTRLEEVELNTGISDEEFSIP
ncbi:MAG: outer membrane lipoprotein-sorting protein, partial [bacterium]